MVVRDYHGFTLQQALTDVEDTISAVRTQEMHRGIGTDAEFIVGHGVIREKLIELLNHKDVLKNLFLVGKSYGSDAVKVEPRAIERLPIPEYVANQFGMGKTA